MSNELIVRFPGQPSAGRKRNERLNRIDSTCIDAIERSVSFEIVSATVFAKDE